MISGQDVPLENGALPFHILKMLSIDELQTHTNPAHLTSTNGAAAEPTQGPPAGTYFQSVVHFCHWFESLFLSEFPAGYQPTARFVLSAHPFGIWAVLNSPVDDTSIRQQVLIKTYA